MSPAGHVRTKSRPDVTTSAFVANRSCGGPPKPPVATRINKPVETKYASAHENETGRLSRGLTGRSTSPKMGATDHRGLAIDLAAPTFWSGGAAIDGQLW